MPQFDLDSVIGESKIKYGICKKCGKQSVSLHNGICFECRRNDELTQLEVIKEDYKRQEKKKQEEKNIIIIFCLFFIIYVSIALFMFFVLMDRIPDSEVFRLLCLRILARAVLGVFFSIIGLFICLLKREKLITNRQ